MANYKLGVELNGQDRASDVMKRAVSNLHSLDSAARTAGHGFNFLGTAAATALGFIAGNVIMQAVSGLVSLGKSVLDANIQMESATASAEALLSGISRDAGSAGQVVEESIGGGAESAADRVRDANERMADEAEDYAQQRADIERDISRVTMDEIERRQAREEEALADMAQAHGRRIGDMQRDIAELQGDWEYSSERRLDGYRRELEAAQAPFKRAQEEVARNKYLVQRAIDEELAKGANADQEKIKRLQARLGWEDQQLGRAQTENEKRLAEVAADQAKEEAHAQQQHERRLNRLQEAIGRENEAYEQQVARRRRDLDEDIAQQKAANEERLTDLQRQLDQADKMHERSLRDMAQSLGSAVGGAAKAVARTVQQAYSEIGNLFAPGGLFAGTTDAREQAQRMFDWIRKEAKATPYTIPQLIDAANRMLVFQMDFTKWFRTLGDVASLTGKPIQQVVEAMGTLMSGDIGEAVVRWKDLYVNLRTITGLKWDAQGQLVTPLAEAIPIVESYLKDRFSGGMETMSKTWTGIMSNMGDLWEGFKLALGKPAFDVMKEGLKIVYGLVGDNQTAFDDLGRQLGTTVAVGIGTTAAVLATVAGAFGLIEQKKADEMVHAIAKALYGPDDSLKTAVDYATGGISEMITGVSGDNKTKIDEFKESVKTTATNIGTAAAAVVEFIKNMREWWNSAETQATIKAMKDFAQDLVTLYQKASDTWNALKNAKDKLGGIFDGGNGGTSGDGGGGGGGGADNKSVVRVYWEQREDGVYEVTQWSDGTYTSRKINSTTSAQSTIVSQGIRQQSGAAASLPQSTGTIINLYNYGTIMGIDDLRRFIQQAVDGQGGRAYGIAHSPGGVL